MLTKQQLILKSFIREIKFLGDDIFNIDKIKRVAFMIEPSFSQFGNPDLVIICFLSNDEKHVIFLEAKTDTYRASSISINEEFIKVEKINSYINTQLTLRYRLAQVLKRNKKNRIEELPEEFKPYSKLITEITEKNKNPTPRKINKKLCIELCKDYLMDVTDYWFVALTKDNKEMIKNLKDFPKEKPIIRDNTGNIWEKVKKYFGMITYSQLDEISPVKNGKYHLAKKYFLVNSTIDKEIKKDGIKELKSKSWNKFSDFINKDLLNYIIDIVEKPIYEKNYINDIKDIRMKYRGSYSYKVGGKIIIKILPHTFSGKEALFLGIEENTFNKYLPEIDNSFDKRFYFGVKNKRIFYFKIIKKFLSADEKESLEKIFSELWSNII